MTLHSKLGMGSAMMAISASGMMMKGIVVLVANLAVAFPDPGSAQILSPGLEAAVGLSLAALAWCGIRTGQMWAWRTAVGAFALVVVATFPGAAFQDMQANMLAMGAVMYAVGALIALLGLRSQGRGCLRSEAGCSSAG